MASDKEAFFIGHNMLENLLEVIDEENDMPYENAGEGNVDIDELLSIIDSHLKLSEGRDQ